MFKVFIDAGHGGTDTGAVSTKLVEESMNLEVALKLKDLLHQSNNFEVTMSRETDINVSLDDRCNKANVAQANVFVSIHHNASGGSGDGFEIYHATGSVNGQRLAKMLEESFLSLGQNKRFVGSGLYAGTKPGDYYVLKNVAMPAILGEFCFIDTPDVNIYDADAEAEAYYHAICYYFGVPIEPTKPLESVHWAEEYFKYLNDNGIEIKERRFDDIPTRGELLAVAARIFKKLSYKIEFL